MNDAINRLIDHTCLKATTTEKDIEKLCYEALQYQFKSVCVNPYYVPLANNILKKDHSNSIQKDVLLCSVVGFPLGASNTQTKVDETKWLINEGCDEIDMVMNIGAMLSNKLDQVEEDILQVALACKGKTLKVILETCFLSDQQIITACKISEKACAQFVKTSTGMGSSGANVHAIELMRQSISNKMKIKASGGIKTIEQAQAMIKAGADRLGTSSSLDLIKNRG